MPDLPLPSFDKPLRLLIVTDPSDAAGLMLKEAQVKAATVGAVVEVLVVPGVLELPPAVALAERLAEFDGYAALGQAGSPAEAAEVGRALMALNLGGACIGQAVLLSGEAADKGGAALAAALHLIAISRKWAGQTKGIGFRA